jgi:hypothetical protein
MARKHEEGIRVDHSIFEYISQNPEKTNGQVADHFGVPYHRVDWAIRRLGFARKNGRPKGWRMVDGHMVKTEAA